MGKSKSSKLVKSPMPPAPWIYINSSRFPEIGGPLSTLIPNALQFTPNYVLMSTTQNVTNLTSFSQQFVCIIVDDRGSEDLAASTAQQYREAAIKRGCNFVSVNVDVKDEQRQKSVNWGTNHIELMAMLGNNACTVHEAAEKLFKTLFKHLTVRETLHLIPAEDMLKTDTVSFPDYKYCAIADSRKHPKDAKIQFVALITSKPEIGPDQRLHWTVADRTGTANFYFQYRGPCSKYTWDWVLALKPGERKSLPRMPMVKIKEKKRVTVLKAPFRAVGTVVGGTGLAIRSVGKGLMHMGQKVKMGSASRWVPEADVRDGKVVKNATTDPTKKTQIKIFNEKGEKTWRDDDGDASTTAGSICDEKVGREFC